MENRTLQISRGTNSSLLRIAEIGDKALILIAENKPALTSDHAVALTVETAIQGTQISLITNKFGADFADDAITFLFHELSNFVTLGGTPDACLQWAKMIRTEYWGWKFDDLIYCIRQGINGRWGKIYGSFTYATFTEWAGKYELERNDYFEQRAAKHKEQYDTVRTCDARKLEYISEDIVRACTKTEKNYTEKNPDNEK